MSNTPPAKEARIDATESFKRLAGMHIADEGVTGILARALATVCDPDVYVVRHVADPVPRNPVTPTEIAYYNRWTLAFAAADALAEHLRRILYNRDTACIAGVWYMVAQLDLAKPEQAVIALEAFDAADPAPLPEDTSA